MKFDQILEKIIERDASDGFVRAGGQLRARIHSRVEVVSDYVFGPEDVNGYVEKITNDRDKERLKTRRGCEFTHWYKDFWRFRVGIFYQRHTPTLVIRKIDLRIPSFNELQLPGEVLKGFCGQRRGLILLTGITGSGKSTTIASMIQHINSSFGYHVLTVEEPIEFTYNDDVSLINQREIGQDVETYMDALRQLALHSPDVLYIGNILDKETCHAALTAAETGVLVFSTLHTVNATSTIERIINFFPPHQHDFIMNQLSFLLKGVFSQRLIPRADRPGLIPAYEIMTLSPTVSRLIRENKFWEIPKHMATGEHYGMVTFQQRLLSLIEAGTITTDTALQYSDKKEELELELRNRGLL